MPKAGGNSVQSIVTPFFDNSERREQQSYQAFCAKIEMDFFLHVKIFMKRKSVALLHAFFFIFFFLMKASFQFQEKRISYELHLSMPY